MMGPQPVEDENFCLRWNDYEKKYAETFRTLREDEHFADVTLACEGHAVKAHRIILCACSGYFGHILRTINPAQHPVLLLSDVRPTDLTALMDFIYFGQVNITQDSLQSFLKVADKLKIKGLCERALIQPEPPLHATITLPIKEEKKPLIGGHTSFDTLLGGRGGGGYIQSPVTNQHVVTLPQQQTLTSTPLSSLRHAVASSAPPAHQSPKHLTGIGRGVTRPSEQQYMIISSPKKAKYSIGAQHASILRNQLVTKDHGQLNNVEVKSEPLSMMSGNGQGGGHHDQDPGGTVSVAEFITTEGDLSLPPLPHGMSNQFMFPPDPSPGDPGAIAPPPAALVTIQPEKESVTSVGTSYSTTRVVSVAVPGTTSLDGHQQDPLHDHVSHHGGPGTPQGHRTHDQEPQDLTPMQDVSNTQLSTTTSPDTPGRKEKERNSRKQCPYCHKDFHEMSLKRHIKDVHFRNQNTYVICPQCCKQYASQNSLYSHLNRVHGVKKDEIHLQNLQTVETEPKYEHDNSLEHEGLLAIRHQGEEAMIVRQQHGDHQGSIIVRSSQGHDNDGIIAVRQSQAGHDNDGIIAVRQSHGVHDNDGIIAVRQSQGGHDNDGIIAVRQSQGVHDNDGIIAVRQSQGGHDNEEIIVRQSHGGHGNEGIIVRQSQGGHDNEGIIVRQQHAVDTNHEGIMDLAQHSDHSN